MDHHNLNDNTHAQMSNDIPDAEFPEVKMTDEERELEVLVDESGDTVEQDFIDLTHQMQRLTDERDQAKDQVMRTMADFQNFRKRTQQEAALLRKFAAENVVTQLLPVLDNFERTISHLESGTSLEVMMGGMKAVHRQLLTVLEGQGVSKIDSIGQVFDPELHEALAVGESSDQPANTVIQELEPGYRMADKVIRPARVKVTPP